MRSEMKIVNTAIQKKREDNCFSELFPLLSPEATSSGEIALFGPEAGKCSVHPPWGE